MRDIAGLSPSDLTDILSNVHDLHIAGSNPQLLFFFLYFLQPDDSSSGAKNEANRTSGGSGGLMEEMNALLARRSDQYRPKVFFSHILLLY